MVVQVVWEQSVERIGIRLHASDRQYFARTQHTHTQYVS